MSSTTHPMYTTARGAHCAAYPQVNPRPSLQCGTEPGQRQRSRSRGSETMATWKVSEPRSRREPSVCPAPFGGPTSSFRIAIPSRSGKAGHRPLLRQPIHAKSKKHHQGANAAKTHINPDRFQTNPQLRPWQAHRSQTRHIETLECVPGGGRTLPQKP